MLDSQKQQHEIIGNFRMLEQQMKGMQLCHKGPPILTSLKWLQCNNMRDFVQLICWIECQLW